MLCRRQILRLLLLVLGGGILLGTICPYVLFNWILGLALIAVSLFLLA